MDQTQTVKQTRKTTNNFDKRKQNKNTGEGVKQNNKRSENIFTCINI